jgi:hypothetical protein
MNPGQLAWIFTCATPRDETAIRFICGEYMVLDADKLFTRNEAIREARRGGWRFAADGTSTCPHCAAQPQAKGCEVKDDWRAE